METPVTRKKKRSGDSLPARPGPNISASDEQQYPHITTCLRDTIDNLAKQWHSDENRPAAEEYFLSKMWQVMQHGYKDLVHEMENFLLLEVKSSMPQIRIHKVYGRVKSAESIKASMEKRRVNQYGQKATFEKPADIVEAVHDLAAFRIITETREEASAVHSWVSKSDRLQKVKRHKTWHLSRPVGPERQSGSRWLPEYGAYECWNHRVALQPPPLPPPGFRQPTAADGLSAYHGVQFEIQVASWADDVYNELAHDLLYKGYQGPLGRDQEGALTLLHGHLKQTGPILENIRIALRGSLDTDVFEKLGEEWKSKLRRGVEQALPAKAQTTDTLSRENEERIKSLNAGLKSVMRESLTGLEQSLHSLARDLPNIANAVEGIVARITKSAEDNQETLQRISEMVDRMDHKAVFNALPFAEGASFDSHAEEHNPTCLPDTRAELLEDISLWIENPNSNMIFWLNGMAGTGKSTISRTVARLRSDIGDLGASFFFKRGEADRTNLAKLVPTLTCQLALTVPSVRPLVKRVIDADPNLARKTVKEQFDKLILGPLSEAWKMAPSLYRLVFVIDALDECDRDADIRLFISILSQPWAGLSHRLRVLVTSRPELPIRLGFSQARGTYQDVILHEMPVPIVEHDINVFLSHQFKIIREEFNAAEGDGRDDRKLLGDWPGDETLQKLTTMAKPLFIFATTLCRFVGDRKLGVPSAQLEEVLTYAENNNGALLDQFDVTYGPVLDSQVSGVPKGSIKSILENFRLVVGSIIILADPLPVLSLSRLLNVSAKHVDRRLDLLHSVLDIPSDHSPVRLLHLSFRDYLTDPDREDNQFWIDQRQTHLNLANNCFRIMRNSLQENTCKMPFPGMRRSAVDEHRIAKALPPELQYACRYWAHHWTATQHEEGSGLVVYEFLKVHLLHWLEALSLMGSARDSIGILQSVISWSRSGSQLSNLSTDAIQLVRANYSVIDEMPLQLYSSILVFAPKKSIVREAFERFIPPWLSLWPKVEDNWDSCRRVLEGHSNTVTSAAFSHDSALLASASCDKTVRVWDAETGECRRVLEGHSEWVTSVVFSRDSALLASASYDETVRVWDAETGECRRVLEGHSSFVYSVVFSRDSALLASASYDKTVRVWDAETGECRRVLEGHSNTVTSVVFSRDSALLASASYDKTVRVWDAETGECPRVLEGHSGDVTSVVFSRDSALLASASYDKTVRVWDAETGECRRVLEGHSEWVTSVAFSHDSALLASASYDKTVRVWDAETGECRRVLEGHSEWVTSVVFSHDSALLASASGDETVRVWDAETGECPRVLEGHSGDVSSVAFSADSALLASASYDKTVRVWDAETGECRRVLEGHSDSVTSVAFSHDSALLASASDDETVRVWDAETGECRHVLEGHSRWGTSVAFSRDSALLALALGDETVRVWDAETGECRRVLEGHSDSVRSVAFSHDSALLASASYDNTVRVWDAEMGECRRVLEGHSSFVYSVVFSRDSALLASASDDKTVRVWDAETGECRHVLEGHSDSVTSVVFSHDSALLASASGDETVRVWDAETGECRRVLEGEVIPPSFLVSKAKSPTSDRELSLRGDSWVTVNGEDWLWLPVECRGGEMTISGTTVAVGCRSGRIVILGISVPGSVE